MWVWTYFIRFVISMLNCWYIVFSDKLDLSPQHHSWDSCQVTDTQQFWSISSVVRIEGIHLLTYVSNSSWLLKRNLRPVEFAVVHKTAQILMLLFCRKATRATLILLPLLGANNFLAMIKYQPTADRPIGFALWSITAYFFSSFQGVFVSFFYCFINADVRIGWMMDHWDIPKLPYQVYEHTMHRLLRISLDLYGICCPILSQKASTIISHSLRYTYVWHIGIV